MTLPSAAYQVENDQILDDTGQVIQLRGVNWFGFETNDHVAHALWARNWRDMIAQMQSLGFNAVRILVCSATLHGAATWGTGNPATDWNTAAEKAADAILAVAPDLLIFVEGIEKNPH